MLPDILSAILRAASFVLLFQAVGVAMFIAAFGQLTGNSRRTIRRLGLGAAIMAIPVVAGQYALEAARMAGELSGMLDGSLQSMAWTSSAGAAVIMRIVALVLLTAGLARDRDASLIDATSEPAVEKSGREARGSKAASAKPAAASGATGLALAGVLLAAISFTLTGHTATHAYRWLSAPLLATHVIIVGFWFGSLLPLVIASRVESRDISARIIDRFSSIAFWTVPVIFVAGLSLTAVLVPALAVFTQPYGELLITKIILFTVLMGLAALNKWRYGPAIAAGDPGASPGFRRSVVTEYVLIVGVLSVTAALTLLYSPE